MIYNRGWLLTEDAFEPFHRKDGEIFKVGDRVESVNVETPYIVPGFLGTVAIISHQTGRLGIAWDYMVDNGGPLCGCCKDGYGSWVKPYTIEKIMDKN